MPARADRPSDCAECGSPLDDDQRYCLQCGARSGARSELLLALLGRLHDRGAAAGHTPTEAGAAAGSGAGRDGSGQGGAGAAGAGAAGGRMAGGRAAGGLGLRLPPVRISALLVLAFVGFGVILGAAAGSRVNDSLAASAGQPLKLLLPQQAPAASTATAPASSSPTAGEPPAAEPEATPAEAPAAQTPAPARTPAPAPASSEGGSAPAGSGGGSGASPQPAAGQAAKLPPIKHVFLIVLSDQPYASVFGPSSQAHYLAGTLEHRGALLVRYYAVAHEQLANEIALLSGQGPTPQTAANCPAYADLAQAGVGADEQVTGQGCLYPPATQTLMGQLSAKHLRWRAYVQGMDEGAGGPGACAHPAPGQGDPSAQAPPGPGYATFRNPFVYFHSVIDGAPACAAADVGLSRLGSDLAHPATTPSLAYIAPDACHDGSPAACPPPAAGGMAAADAFLKQVVPGILASPAYKQGGLLAITVDEAPSGGELADSSSCCGQPQYPNLPVAAETAGLAPDGGGQVGLLLLSPFIKGGTTSQEPYNHFSLLRTIEDAFALKHLGYAALAKVPALEPSLFSAYRP